MFSTTQGNIETFSTQTQLVLDQLLLEESDSVNKNFQKPLETAVNPLKVRQVAKK